MKKILLLIAFTGLVSLANAQCHAAFTFTVNGDSVLFNDISTYTTSVVHTWDFGDGTGGMWASPPNPLHVYYPYAGKYRVCLTISDTMPSTCHSAFCDTITISAGQHYPCNAIFTAWVDTSVTFPVHFQTNMPSYYVAKQIWNFGDGTYDSTGTNVHQYATQGNYYVCLTIKTNAGDICNYCDTVNVIACSQTLNVSFTHSLNVNTATFTSNCSGSTLSNPWFWSFGDGYSANSQNPVHTYLYNGTYNVCLTYVRDSTGCSKTYCDTLSITNASTMPCNALFSYYPDTMATHSIHYYDLSTTNIIAWNWSFPGGTPSSSIYPYQSVSYTAAGTYAAYLSVTNQSGLSCTYYDTVHVGINCANTNAYFTMNPTSTPHVWDVVNMATGTPPISYSWNWGDGSPYSTGQNPSHTYSQAGWYDICLTIADANGCGSSYCTHDSLYKLGSTNTIITVFVTSPTTGVNNFTSSNNIFSVYPNPANENIIVEATSLAKDAIISIYNIEGEMLMQQTMQQAKTNIDISMLARGMYFIKVEGEKVYKVEKFVKE